MYNKNMSEIKRPMREDASQRQSVLSTQPTFIKRRSGENYQGLKLIFVLLTRIVVVACLVYGFVFFYSTNKTFKNETDWQAVFLNDGQVYFGKVIYENRLNVILENIYYLQNPGSLQQGENNLNKQSGEIVLIKLGSEIHGPTDRMKINRENVLFVEDLKDDSKIVDAIKLHAAK